MRSDLYNKSIKIIRESQSAWGSYIASPTFPTYQYSWLRDGSFIAHAMDVAGEYESAAAFFRWVGRTIMRYRSKVENIYKTVDSGQPVSMEDMLHTRYSLDGHEVNVDSTWGNAQIDGYGTWLWAFAEHMRRSGDASLLRDLNDAVQTTIHYLELVWVLPSYDCWEEFPEFLHPYSLSCVFSGLTNISPYLPSSINDRLLDLSGQIRDYLLSNGIHNGKFCKLIDPKNQESHLRYEADASLVGLCQPNHVVPPDHPVMRETIQSIEQDLLRPGGGVYRYRSDVYYGGGEWLLLAAWLGWYYTCVGKISQSEALRTWIEDQAGPNGVLAEQVSDHLLAPDHFSRWVEKWGPVASPLTWSHAMYIILVDAIEEAKRK